MIKNKIKNIGKAILIFILFFYSWIFQLIPVLLFNINLEKLSAKGNIYLSLFSTISLLIVLFIIYRKELIEEAKNFKKNFVKFFDKSIIYYICGLGLMMLFNSLLNIFFNAGTANNENAVQSMISTAPWVMLILSGLIAPITEEIVFRKSIRKIFDNRIIYVLASGLLFGVAHVFSMANNFTDWLFILPYGALGVFFALMNYDTKSIWPSVMFHIIHNTTLIFISIYS